MTFDVHPSARLEYAEALTHYAEISKELGRSFYDHVDQGIADILSMPKACPIKKDRVRAYHLERFPYSIIYELDNDRVYVLSISFQKRHPDHWHGRKES